MADTLPDDWRDQMVEMIRGAREADGALFAGGPTLSPLDQIEVYREQFRLRMWDALLEEIPGLAKWLGDDVDDVAWAYLADHPPESWTLARIADRLADWMEARGRPAVEVDVARLDAAVMAGFVAGEGRIPRPDELDAAMRGELRIRLQPHVRLLRARWSVHRWRSVALADQAAPPPVEGDFTLVVFRVDRKMRHLEVEPAAWALLRALDGGASLDEALGAALAEAGDVQQLVAKLPGWFQLFTQRGLLELA